MKKRIVILVPDNDLDSVVRATLVEITKISDIRIIIAGPDESSQDLGVDAPPINSKFDLRAIKAYRHIMRRHNVNLTFSPSTSGLATMLAASIGLSVKNIGYRGTQAKVRRSDPTNYLALLNPRVRHIVCETPDIEQALAKLIAPSKVSTSRKPFMLSWVDEAMQNPVSVPSTSGHKLRLIYIGMSAQRPHKGLRVLIDAMNMVKDIDVALTVIGSADETDINAAPPSVTFLGPQKNAARYIPTHNLYVLPSLRDASPRVLREAQACGVPCVVSDIPGARDLIVDNQTGLLVKPGDPKAIADTIRKLHADPALLQRLAGNTRPFIQDNFDMQNYVDYHIDLFNKIANE